jgi:hypothetical protein
MRAAFMREAPSRHEAVKCPICTHLRNVIKTNEREGAGGKGDNMKNSFLL